MPKKIIEKLVPEFQKVMIKDKIYEIGELSLKQTIQLSREIIRVVVKFSKADLKALEGGKSNIDDLLSFFVPQHHIPLPVRQGVLPPRFECVVVFLPPADRLPGIVTVALPMEGLVLHQHTCLIRIR